MFREAGGLLGSSAALPHKKRALSEGGGDRDQPDKVEKRNRRFVHSFLFQLSIYVLFQTGEES